ncbi:MAG: Gfo/Idh/MocA family oxidoreductase [Candidatus Omnitrophica bacterium]|nr:Gfo/Idh/MocA family oxidoreductase [Candidatus Omnitrophota bacterium]
MKILIIGYGSIGKRHAGNVIATGHQAILLRHAGNNLNTENLREYYALEDAIKSEGKIDAAIICSPTSRHLDDAAGLIKFDIPFLMEKPPAVDLNSALKLKKIIEKNKFKKYDIAFNLRHYPGLQFIKYYLPEMGRVYSARVSAGFYLPHWRENVDYRQMSSARKELGGGVHLDLIHEIDYILWFFGLPESVIGYINRISNLEISSEDICSAIFQYKDGSLVQLYLDYLSHKRLRGCQINAENSTLEWSMDSGRVMNSSRDKHQAEEIFKIDPAYDLNDTYIKELNNFLEVISGKSVAGVSIAEAVDTMRVLEAIKISSRKGKKVLLKHIRA